MFNPDNYIDRIEESKKRLEITWRFEEPDRVPIQISTGGSFYAKLFGYNIRDYYTDLEVCLEVQLKGLEWAFDELQDDRVSYGLHLDFGPIGEGLYFGFPIEYPDDTSPWVVKAIETPEQIEAFEVPDPAESPGIQEAYRRIEKFKELVEKRGIRLPAGGGIGIHPPLSCACALAEPELIFSLMYEAPDLIHRFFAKLLEAFCRLQDYRDKLAGRKTESIGLADDHSAFISNAMHREFVFPYNMAIYERYGKKGRHLHADGPNDHHFEMYANDMKLTSMDIGGFSDIAKAKPALHGKTVFSGGLNCRDLYYDLETAKPAIDRAIRIGAPGGGFILAVGGETYVGVNPNTLVQAVKYAKEVGRYPIRI
ncbi:MAG: uroporphyrinogen decarboxylase family protein [Armatimonadota bacterium]|nr:uroporphyrinogen decarboxylase family protein [Armatimonadota bacterium]